MDPAQAYEQDVISRHLSSRVTGVDSPVSLSYKDTTVLVTGGAGFLGKHLLEKLIRSCDIKKAYLILRPKKGKSIEERLEKIRNDPIFEVLRSKGADYKSKLTAIEGDLTEIRLGVTEDDWNKLTTETEYIFHVAATVNFEQPLKSATLTNVRGTREMITLAKECRKLRSFVHVSTAYSHATKDRIGKDVKEDFYQSPMPPELMLDMIQALDDEVLRDITPKLIQKWPNTYTFTKAIAEELVRKATADLPICIVRPTIVINSYREPLPGYLDPSCIYGPSGILVGGGYGALHILLTKRSIRIDFVPIDYVNNAIIAAGWAAAEGHHAKIYTVSTLRTGSIWDTKLNVLNGRMITEFMTPKAMWYYFMIDTDSLLIFNILNLIVQSIPGYFIDGVLWLMGKPVIAIKTYTKVSKLQKVVSYFLRNEWNFDDQNLMALQKKMTTVDRNIFFFDTTDVDDEQYMLLWGLGVRKYLMKDGLKDTRYAIKKQSWLKVLHYFVVSVYFYVLYNVFWLFFYVFKCCFSVFV